MKILLSILILVVMVAVISWRYLKRPQQNTDWPPEVLEKVKADKAAREKVRTKYPEVFKALTECLFKNDPMGINFKTNTDEYEPEVGAIIPRLTMCTSEEDALQVVYEEFCVWFGNDTAGKKDNYRQVSKEIWEIWNKMKTQPDH